MKRSRASRAARKGWRTRRANQRSWENALSNRITHSEPPYSAAWLLARVLYP